MGFAAFGSVILAFPTKNQNLDKTDGLLVNQGTATKYADVAKLENHYSHAPSGRPGKDAISLLACEPRYAQTSNDEVMIPIGILERHPYTTQMFVPFGMSRRDNDIRYLVVVAPGISTHPSVKGSPDRTPDLNELRAFVSTGDQAVIYNAGVWHAPMIVVGKSSINFVVLQAVNGNDAEDCDEVVITTNGIGVLMPATEH